MGKYFGWYNKGKGWIGKERDLTQIGKDNNVVDGCLGREWRQERVDQFGPVDGISNTSRSTGRDLWREKRV